MKNYLGAGNETGTYYHYFAGFLITFITAFLLYHFQIMVEWQSIVVGISAGVVAGAMKELVWDKWMKKGTPTKPDFFDTCWGVLVGAIAVTIFIGIFL